MQCRQRSFHRLDSGGDLRDPSHDRADGRYDLADHNQHRTDGRHDQRDGDDGFLRAFREAVEPVCHLLQGADDTTDRRH